MGNKSSVSKNAKCQSKELYFDVPGQIWQIIFLNEKIFDIQKLIWKTNKKKLRKINLPITGERSE